MKTIQLVFGIHGHQSEGDHPEVFESQYQRVHKPFLSVLNGFPDFPAVLYYSGPLLEWMEEAHPEFLMLLDEMVRRKQVELLGGGFYEPILTMVPTSDKLGQMEKMTTYLRARFGVRPRGCWLPQQVWEPHLVGALRNSGMDFTFLDDRYFQLAGVEGGALHRPCLTEDQGKTVVIFPVCRRLEEAALGRTPRQLIGALHDLADGTGRRVAVLLLDAEALGREDPRRRLFDQHGLAHLLEGFRESHDWLQPMTSRRYLRQCPPGGRVYFPALSCQELAGRVPSGPRPRAAVEAAATLPSVGLFRQYLTRYPEANLLYARMVYTHLLVNQVRGDKYKKLAARTELWKGQSGAVYWDSPTGGVHASHLRSAAYRAFLEAEEIARVSEMFIPSLISLDFDMDGENELMYLGEAINAFVHRLGGALFELDFLPAHWNYQDTLARWPQSHRGPQEDGCDRHWRKAFLDHFLPPRTSPERFARGEYEEGGDFIGQPFEVISMDREAPELLLRRGGQVQTTGLAHPLTLEKRYRFHPSAVELQVRLINPDGRPVNLWYASEVNLSVPAREEMRLFGVRGGKRERLAEGRCESTGLDGAALHDLRNGVLLSLCASRPFDLWASPVEARRLYQSACLLPGWKLRLQGGESWEVALTLSLQKQEE